MADVTPLSARAFRARSASLLARAACAALAVRASRSSMNSALQSAAFVALGK
jgi:hypothetical protein